MKSRSTLWNTLWLILILVALGLYLALVEVPTAKKEDEKETRSKKVFHFVVEDVEAFELITPSGTIKVQRNPKNSRWNIVHPLAIKGEDGVINQLLLSLEEAQITRVVEEDPKSLADFGLKDPTFKMVLEFKTGETKTLLMGDSSPIGHDAYLKLADEKRVLLSLLTKNQVNLPLNELRNSLLFDFAPRNITAMKLKYGKETQRIIKEGEHWKLTAPVNAQGDADEISNFLNSIRSERIETFISETPKNLASFGLESPSIVLNLKAEKAKQTWLLKVGKSHDKDSYYAQRGQPKNIVTISKSLVETLSKNPLSFMEKSLITFKDEDVTAIENRDGKKTVHMVRNSKNKGQWEFENQGNGTVDSATVNTLLLDLQEARIDKFAPSKKLKPFGLDTPRKELVIFKKDGSKTTLRLGNSDKDKNKFYVLRSVDQSIIELNADTANKIFRGLDDFKSKKLMKFDPEQVARIKIEYSDKTFELNKKEDQWVLVQPEEKGDLKPFVGKDILWTLTNLEYESKLSAKEVIEDTGLEKPQLTLTLKDRTNNSLGQLKIGGPVKDRPLLYSQLADDPTLYSIKDRTLSEIPDTLDRFLKNSN